MGPICYFQHNFEKSQKERKIQYLVPESHHREDEEEPLPTGQSEELLHIRHC